MLRSFYLNGHTYKVLSRHFEVDQHWKKEKKEKNKYKVEVLFNVLYPAVKL